MSKLKKGIAFRLKQTRLQLMKRENIKHQRPFCERFGLIYPTYRDQESGNITLDFIEDFSFKTGANIHYLLSGIGSPLPEPSEKEPPNL